MKILNRQKNVETNLLKWFTFFFVLLGLHCFWNTIALADNTTPPAEPVASAVFPTPEMEWGGHIKVYTRAILPAHF